jgi:hypothetical protein
MTGLFSSIPRTDPLSVFGSDGNPKGQEITKLLGLKPKDVARATHLSESSIRYDLRMPDALKAWLIDVATTMNLVAEFFGDPHKTNLWFSIPNPQLGGIPPVDLVKMGRVRKLLSFVQSALKQNNP